MRERSAVEGPRDKFSGSSMESLVDREGKGRGGARVCMLAAIMLVHADAGLRSNS